MRALKQITAIEAISGTDVTTQAHEGIETVCQIPAHVIPIVTTQAHEGIETDQMLTQKSACPRQKNENETQFYVLVVFYFIFAF